MARQGGKLKRFFGLVLMLASFTSAVGGGYYLSRGGIVSKEMVYAYSFALGAGVTGALGSMVLIRNPKKKD